MLILCTVHTICFTESYFYVAVSFALLEENRLVTSIDPFSN